MDVERVIVGATGIPKENNWEVLDELGDLRLVHYLEGCSREALRLRGTVVDVKTGLVVCESFGSSPDITLDEISPRADGSLRFTSLEGEEIVVPAGRYRCKVQFEGVVLRFFLHDGQVHPCSHKKIHAVRSRWGYSRYYVEHFKELGGPENLFDPAARYSPHCYIFLVASKEFLTGSRQSVGPGYIVYLGCRTLWDPENSPYSPAEKSPPRLLDTVEALPDPLDSPVLLSPPFLSLEEANRHLKYGFSSEAPSTDPRSGNGEALVLYVYREDDTLQTVYRLRSSAYTWRTDMRDGIANIVHRFYTLLDLANVPNPTPERFRSLVRFEPLSPEEAGLLLAAGGPILSRPLMSEERTLEVLGSKEGRCRLIWTNFVLSLPPLQQVVALGAFKKMKDDRRAVATWLFELYKNKARPGDCLKTPPGRKPVVLPKRAFDLIERCKREAQVQVQKPQKRRASFGALVEKKLRFYLNEEDGPSLYKLVKAMTLTKEGGE